MLYAMHMFESFEPSLGGGGGRSDMGGALAGADGWRAKLPTC